MKYILINGAPRSGKDTAGAAIREAIRKTGALCIHEKFSAPLKTAFGGMMNSPVYKDYVVGFWEERKEEVVPGLRVSFRQWQIDFSEKFMKPLYGKDIFARLLLQRTENHMISPAMKAFTVITDCGFQIEVDKLCERFDHKDILLMEIRREGYDFSNDSREYVRVPNTVFKATVWNDSDLETFRQKAIINVAHLLD